MVAEKEATGGRLVNGRWPVGGGRWPVGGSTRAELVKKGGWKCRLHVG